MANANAFEENLAALIQKAEASGAANIWTIRQATNVIMTWQKRDIDRFVPGYLTLAEAPLMVVVCFGQDDAAEAGREPKP